MTAHIYRITVDIGRDYEARCLARMGSDGCYELVNVRNSYPHGRYTGKPGSNVEDFTTRRMPPIKGRKADMKIIDDVKSALMADILARHYRLNVAPYQDEGKTWKTGKKDLPPNKDFFYVRLDP